MFQKLRIKSVGCGIAALMTVSLSAGIAAAEENSDASYLSQFTAADYVDVADYDSIPVEAKEGDLEGVQNDIGEYLENSSSFKKDLPQPFVDRNTAALKGQLQAYADQYNISLADFMKYYDSSLTDDTYEEYIENLGLTYSKKLVALQAVADAEGLVVTDDELEEQMEGMAEAAGYSDVAEYEEASMLAPEEIREMLMSQKVLEFLENNAVYETEETE